MSLTKYRIYDLVHIYISPEGEDLKAIKHKQSELTKVIVSICEGQSLAVKSASSSIEEGQIKSIVSSLIGHGYNKDYEAVIQELRGIHSEKKVKPGKSTKAQVPETPAVPHKKPLIIVRRIKPTPQQQNK